MKHHKQPKSRQPALESLTAAALILPGLLQQMPAYAGADDDEVDFQYSHFQEGKRDIYATNFTTGSIYKTLSKSNRLNPIEVESLNGKARVSLTDRVKFAFNYTQDTWAGATPIGTVPVHVFGGGSPYLSGTKETPFFIKKNGDMFSTKSIFDFNTGMNGPLTVGVKNNQLTHVLTSASPETRQQGDFKLTYDGDNASLSAGGGLSVENDYESRFGNLGTRWDFNDKRTSVNWGLSYTNSDTHALLDPQVAGFMGGMGPYDEAKGAILSNVVQVDNLFRTFQLYSPLTKGTLSSEATIFNGVANVNSYLRGNRQDWGNTLGLTQVLTKNTELELGVGYTHSGGYLTNPYKAVYVFNATPPPDQDPNQPILFAGVGIYESRPHERNQITGNMGLHYYLEALDAGLHGSYNVFHDDWSITSHTFDADWVQPLGAGWIITPSVRYYSQSAADFYAPYLTTVQVTDPNTGQLINSSLNKSLPNYYSSDQRLSGFGAVSGGVTVTKQFAKGVQIQTGFEYYSHQGGLKLGGDGEQAFADYDYWTANAALKLNLGALHFGGGMDTSHTVNHSAHNHFITPAGIMFNHALAEAGNMMVGYRYMRNEQAGEVLNGSNAASPDQVHLAACGAPGCGMSTRNMTMNMHMLELMFAPADWLTLMLMPQWTDTNMNMRPLVKHGRHVHGSVIPMLLTQQSGGFGDTGLYALFKLFDQPNNKLVLSLGGTAPTGSVNEIRRQIKFANPEVQVNYGMQQGSGTWDLRPSLTYSGTLDAFNWGAQATGTKRLESRNKSGYALGDIFQSSAWGGYQWTHWLSNTVRGIYTWQDQIRGEFNPGVSSDGTPAPYLNQVHLEPSDLTSNYGGRFVDLGLGINVTVPSGSFAGNTFKFEWLQPLHTDYNGYQLDRSGALTATWGLGF